MTQRSNIVEPFKRITVDEAKQIVDSGEAVQVIDVRKPDEYATGHVPGAVLIPVDDVYARKDELPADRKLLFVCGVGVRSALACEMAAALGFNDLYNIEGGTDAWIKRGLPVER